MRAEPDASRAVAGLLCIASVFLCLAYDRYRSDLPEWWRDNGGGVPYVIFWITACFVIFPFRKSIISICLGVTLATCLLELLQLWQPLWLEQFRTSRFGAALLGSEFSWSDMPPYFLGGLTGYVVLRFITPGEKHED